MNQHILEILYSYTNEPEYKLKHQISGEFNSAHIINLNFNPIPTNILIKHPEYINNTFISRNNSDKIVKFLIKNPKYIDFHVFSSNSNTYAVKFLIKNPKYINFHEFSTNFNNIAVDYLLQNPQYIDYNSFGRNINDKALYHFINHIESRNISIKQLTPYCFTRNYYTCNSNWISDDSIILQLSMNLNENATKYLIKNYLRDNYIFNSINLFTTNDTMARWLIDNYQSRNARNMSNNSHPLIVKFMLNKKFNEIVWESFTMNSSDIAVDFLIKNTRYICWHMVSANLNARMIDYLIKNRIENIRYPILFSNPAAFEIDDEKSHDKFLKWSSRF